MTTNNPETNLPELPDGYFWRTWLDERSDWVDWNPTWTFTVINGKKGKS